MKRIWNFLKQVWMEFARILGWINTRILLTIVYVVVIGIGAVIMKVLRNDPLDRRYSSVPTYWKPKETSDHSPEHARHQF